MSDSRMILERDPNQSSAPSSIPLPQLASVAPGGSVPEPPAPTGNGEMSPMRAYLRTRGSSAGADRIFVSLMAVCGCSIFAIVGLILAILIVRSEPTLHAIGWKFFGMSEWNPVSGEFGALPFIYGTVVSSILALCLAVPLALGVAIFLTELCPRRLRAPISFLTELLAAIPSVVYGLWAVFVLVPMIRDQIGPVLSDTFGWTGLFDGANFGVGMLPAAIILAVMVLPIISSLTREVMMAVPINQREAMLALGATRWEMIRTGVLRNARIGIVGSVILGLGRALGETMAVTMVIGNHASISKSLFAPAATLASVIAGQFTEATGTLYPSALIEIGLALFLVTVVVNGIARLLVWAVTRGAPARTH